jgi:hypothetical protein
MQVSLDDQAVATQRSAELSAASDALAAKGVQELKTAAVAGAVARGAAATGVANISSGTTPPPSAPASRRRTTTNAIHLRPVLFLLT